MIRHFLLSGLKLFDVQTRDTERKKQTEREKRRKIENEIKKNAQRKQRERERERERETIRRIVSTVKGSFTLRRKRGVFALVLVI